MALSNLLLNPLTEIFFLRFYFVLFLERGREGEIEGEKHQCVVASHSTPTGSQAGTQSTEPHQPGPSPLILHSCIFHFQKFPFIFKFAYSLLMVFCCLLIFATEPIVSFFFNFSPYILFLGNIFYIFPFLLLSFKYFIFYN